MSKLSASMRKLIALSGQATQPVTSPRHPRMQRLTRLRFPLSLRLLLVALCLCAGAAKAADGDCLNAASASCYIGFAPPGAPGQLHYFTSLMPGSATTPTSALIVIHGHPRDANKTFNAALQALTDGDATAHTLLVAPVFQVADDHACHTDGVPSAQPGDLLWRCSTWLDGGRAENGDGFSAFNALDAVVAELHARWPGLRTITIAGFSAGAQLVQHYIGFAQAPAGTALALRYVVADPGTWLYFDAARAAGDGTACSSANRWKYGTDDLPADLPRSAAAARAHYAAADISYLEGALDQGTGRGTYNRILDKSCAANAQGVDRLHRGLAYAEYDRALLAPEKHRKVIVVPGCAHDVACVFPSSAGRSALLGTPPH